MNSHRVALPRDAHVMNRASSSPRSVCGRRDDERLIAGRRGACRLGECLELGLGLVDELARIATTYGVRTLVVASRKELAEHQSRAEPVARASGVGSAESTNLPHAPEATRGEHRCERVSLEKRPPSSAPAHRPQRVSHVLPVTPGTSPVQSGASEHAEHLMLFRLSLVISMISIRPERAGT